MAQGLTRLIDNDDLEVSFVGRPGVGGQPVMVAFTGIRQGLGGIETEGPEFRRISRLYGATYFVVDRRQSWGNAVDFDALRALVAETTPGAEIDMIGNSMGGFMALASAGPMRARLVLAFSPQFSVKPDIVPFERRWQAQRNAITNWRFPSLQNCWRDAAKYFVFFGDQPPDSHHAALFPKRDNLLLTQVPGNHGLAKRLKGAGLLYETIERCLAGTYRPDWLLSALRDAPMLSGAIPAPDHS